MRHAEDADSLGQQEVAKESTVQSIDTLIENAEASMLEEGPTKVWTKDCFFKWGSDRAGQVQFVGVVLPSVPAGLSQYDAEIRCYTSSTKYTVVLERKDLQSKAVAIQFLKDVHIDCER
jgi:hypothetical protein